MSLNEEQRTGTRLGGTPSARTIELLSKWEWMGVLTFSASLMFSIAVVQTISVLLILAWLWRIVRRESTSLVWLPLDLPVIAFLIARVLSVLLAPDFPRSAPALWIEIPFAFVYFALSRRFLTASELQLKHLIRITGLAAALAGIAGAGKYALGLVDRASSTTSGYYTLGMYLAAVLALLLPLGRVTGLFRQRWVWGSGLAAISLGILLTFNRIHWGIAGMMTAVVGAWKERRILLVALVGAVAAILFVPDITSRFEQLLSFTSQTSGRNVLWRGAGDLAFERPVLGFGPRSFAAIFPYFDLLEDKGVGTWHNDVLQVYMESGAVGLLAYVWLLVSSLLIAARNARRFGPRSFLGSISVGLALSLLAMFLGGLVGGFVTDPLISLFFRLTLALVAALAVRVSLPTSTATQAAGD